jgi:CTP synthase
VAELRSIGIQPDMIVARSDYPVGGDLKSKIAQFCDVEPRAVVPLVTLPTIYEAPLVLDEAGVGDLIVDRLGLESRRRPNWTVWKHMVQE